MIEYRTFQVFFLIIIILQTESMEFKLREEERPSRNYRPSKWITNAAMDVWYGNKTVIDVLSREFNDIMRKLANRPGEFNLIKYL